MLLCFVLPGLHTCGNETFDVCCFTSHFGHALPAYLRSGDVEIALCLVATLRDSRTKEPAQPIYVTFRVRPPVAYDCHHVRKQDDRAPCEHRFNQPTDGSHDRLDATPSPAFPGLNAFRRVHDSGAGRNSSFLVSSEEILPSSGFRGLCAHIVPWPCVPSFPRPWPCLSTTEQAACSRWGEVVRRWSGCLFGLELKLGRHSRADMFCRGSCKS